MHEHGYSGPASAWRAGNSRHYHETYHASGGRRHSTVRPAQSLRHARQPGSSHSNLGQLGQHGQELLKHAA